MFGLPPIRDRLIEASFFGPERQFNPTARMIFFGFVLLGGLGILLAKLYYIQVVKHEYWASKINNHSEVTVRIPSVRGEIRDRNGVTLAENRASYAIQFYLPDIVRNYRQVNGKVPTSEYLATVRGMRTVAREPDIIQIVNDGVMPRLQQLGLAVDYNSARLQRHFRNQQEVPFAYRDDIDFASVAKLAVVSTAVPGVEVAKKPTRHYPYGALGAHLLGYVGAVKDISKQYDIDDFTFYDPDLEGKSEVERAYDKWLRGTPGARVLQRNGKGVIEGEAQRIEPKQGNNVYLTIDARIQYIVERALRDADIGRGAAVVVNPANGEILAMASVPSYDPNVFIPSIAADDWKQLTADETDPLTNRAVQGYAPGSIFKTVTALAGLRAGIPATRVFVCNGGVQYGNKYMKCWIYGKGTHGPLTLPDALKHSCNAFFYQWGNAAGIDQIDAVGDALGLGHRTGVPLSGESAGVLPGPNWLRSNSPGERWSDGYTANTSIGQGYVLTSPLQMAMVAATIANRGVSYEPRLVYRVLDHEGRDVNDPDTNRLVMPHESKVRADLHRSGITDGQIEAVREGMRRVVAEGTGKRAQIKGVSVAGKTGTAQFWRGDVKDNHTWFISFAPYDAPKYALCVMVQGAKSGGGVSAPIAQRIMEQCLALDNGFDPGLAAMTPAQGSFAQIEAVDYKNLPLPESATAATSRSAPIPVGKPVPFEALDDPETPETIDAPPRGMAPLPDRPTSPDIRDAADPRGRVPLKPFLEQPATPAPERNNVLKPFFQQ
jgi:penicillin-binding protein 2